ncbi:MAG: hypothetical protein WBA74_19070 [Cyclobacteriaceae bacterium]
MNILIAERSPVQGDFIASQVKAILGNDIKIAGPYDNPRETVRNIWIGVPNILSYQNIFFFLLNYH